MQRPTFTWTELGPGHLIESVCDLCTRRIAVSARADLIHAVEKIHACRDLCISGVPQADRQPPRRPHS